MIIKDFPIEDIRISQPEKHYKEKDFQRLRRLILKGKKMAPIIIDHNNWIVDRQSVFLQLRDLGYKKVKVEKLETPWEKPTSKRNKKSKNINFVDLPTYLQNVYSLNFEVDNIESITKKSNTNYVVHMKTCTVKDYWKYKAEKDSWFYDSVNQECPYEV